jgi:hypothetical protein
MHIVREKKTLPNFYRRFLQLKAQAPEVTDDQVITQAIKALRVKPMHNHLLREWLKTVPELYEQFAKFSKSEALHFRKLEKQRKAPKNDEATRPTRYNDNQCGYPKLVHNIDSDGYGPPEDWEKNFGTPPQERNQRAFDLGQINRVSEAAHQAKATAGVVVHSRTSLRTSCITAMKSTTVQKTTPYSSNPKERWSKTPSSPHNNHKEVNHLTQWAMSHH